VPAELQRDLWPMMLRKLDTQAPCVAWYDWALVGMIGSAVLAVPDLVLLVIYHL
jgi:hypothetical protein